MRTVIERELRRSKLFTSKYGNCLAKNFHRRSYPVNIIHWKLSGPRKHKWTRKRNWGDLMVVYALADLFNDFTTTNSPVWSVHMQHVRYGPHAKACDSSSMESRSRSWTCSWKISLVPPVVLHERIGYPHSLHSDHLAILTSARFRKQFGGVQKMIICRWFAAKIAIKLN